jgi:hypothetical protein
MLPLGGLHGKHAVQLGIWVPTQHLLWDQGKPRKTLIELAGTVSLLFIVAEVEVTLRPTVSRPVRLGVLPLLEQVTRSYIYLSDNYFLYFSCGAPSLTRGRVCNLQCNDASSISSYIATGLSVSSSWYRAPSGAHTRF